MVTLGNSFMQSQVAHRENNMGTEDEEMSSEDLPVRSSRPIGPDRHRYMGTGDSRGYDKIIIETSDGGEAGW